MKRTFLVLILSLFAFYAQATDPAPILKRAETGNLRALNQSFGLLKKADGHLAEEISTSIGKSIRAKPKNFLSSLKKNRKKVSRLDAIVGGLGPDYVDEYAKQKTELEARLKAIQTVKANTLKGVRKECEDLLKESIVSAEESIRSAGPLEVPTK